MRRNPGGRGGVERRMRVRSLVLVAAAAALTACGQQAPVVFSEPDRPVAPTISPSPERVQLPPRPNPSPSGSELEAAVLRLPRDCDDLEPETSRMPRRDVESPSPALQQEAMEQMAVSTAIREYWSVEAPDEHGGTWIARDSEGELLTVAFTRNVAEHEAALRERLGPDARFVVTEAEHSVETLRSLQDSIDHSEPAADSIVAGIGVDELLNRVALTVVAVDDEARRVLGERYGPEMICIDPLDGPPLGTEPGGGAPGVVPLPTTDVANMNAALTEGVVLAGDEDMDGGCLWVEMPDGTPTAVVWPPGYGARFTPEGAELVNETGTVVAREGDMLSMDGGGSPYEPMERCMVGESPRVAGSVSTD